MEINIKNLNKVISHNQVLENINLKLTGNKIYGFYGKNGSGKTMLMRAICGLIVPTSGEVQINGKILGKDISFPESIGALIENPGFLQNCSGFKNLKYLARIQNKINDSEILGAMEKVGLDPNEKKSFRKYSLGMKQKLGIAATIMENPDILILDEPFNALDEETVEKIRNLILSKKDENRIIILSCHDREELENLSDVIIEIKNGQIIQLKENENEKG